MKTEPVYMLTTTPHGRFVGRIYPTAVSLNVPKISSDQIVNLAAGCPRWQCVTNPMRLSYILWPPRP